MEKDVLKATDHQHVVSLHDAFEYDGKAYLVLELCPRGVSAMFMILALCIVCS
jgi:serine/threonine protein kinase